MKALILCGLLLSAPVFGQFGFNLGHYIKGTWIFHENKNLTTSAYKFTFRADKTCHLVSSDGASDCHWKINSGNVDIDLEQPLLSEGLSYEADPSTGNLKEVVYLQKTQEFTLSILKFDFFQPLWKLTYQSVWEFPENSEIPARTQDETTIDNLMAQPYNRLKGLKPTSTMALNLPLEFGSSGGVLRFNEDFSADMILGFNEFEKKPIFWGDSDGSLLLSYTPGDSITYRVLDKQPLGYYVLAERNLFGKESIQSTFVGIVDVEIMNQVVERDDILGQWQLSDKDDVTYEFTDEGKFGFSSDEDEFPYSTEGYWRLEDNRFAAYRYRHPDTYEEFNFEESRKCLEGENPEECMLFQSRDYQILNRHGNDEILVLRQLKFPELESISTFIHPFYRK